MGRKRNMPSRKKIFEYWYGKLDNVADADSCFKCAFNIGVPDRAHIISVFDGGSDDVSNLHLLCSNCHKESEVWSGEMYDLWFEEEDNNVFKIKAGVLYHLGKLKLDKKLSILLDDHKQSFIDWFGNKIWNDEINKTKKQLQL